MGRKEALEVWLQDFRWSKRDEPDVAYFRVYSMARKVVPSRYRLRHRQRRVRSGSSLPNEAHNSPLPLLCSHKSARLERLQCGEGCLQK